MLITKQPTATQTYDFNGQTQMFDYNVVAALTNVTIDIQSEQATIFKIISHGSLGAADIYLNEDIQTYITAVRATTGINPTVFVNDNTGVFPNYTGSYQVITNSVWSGGSILGVLSANGSGAYQGDKLAFPDSSLMYRYQNGVSIQFLDRTINGTFQSNLQLFVNQQQLFQNGSLKINLSEIAKTRVPQIGHFGLQATITEYDFQNEAISTVTSAVIMFVNSSLFSKNYGNKTMFNPNNGGSLLESTGDTLLHNDDKIITFFLNFVTNALVTSFNINNIIAVADCFDIDNNFIGSTETDITDQSATGLNSVDISQSNWDELFNILKNEEPEYILFSIKYSGKNAGEFDSFEYDNTEFVISDEYYTAVSGTFKVPCQKYALDNRKDFFFYLNNVVGGFTTFLFNQYKRRIQNEIQQVRNGSRIGNFVARATEYYDLTYKFMDLVKTKFLTGFDLTLSPKEDGVYESQTIKRIDQYSIETDFVMQPQESSIENADLYKDQSFTIMRPVFDDTITTPISIVTIESISNIADISATVTCLIDQIGTDPVIERGVILNTSASFTSVEPSSEYKVLLSGLSPGTQYAVQPYVVTINSSYVGPIKQFTTLT